jgi:hypothetical protein
MNAYQKRVVWISGLSLAAGILIAAGLTYMGLQSYFNTEQVISKAENAARPTADTNVSPAPARQEQKEQSDPYPQHGSRAMDIDLQAELAQAEHDQMSLLADLEELEQENDQLAQLNHRLKAQLEDILNWILVNFKGRFPLAAGSVHRLDMEPVTADLMLHPEVAEFLHITPAEEAIINDAFAYADSFINQIEYEMMSYSVPHPDQAVLRIPPYPEDGELLRDDLYTSLESALGIARFDTMLDITEDELNKTFHRFGDATRTIIFEVTYNPEDNTPQLLIKDGWVYRDEQNRKIVEATEEVVDDLPLKYAQYYDYLPMDFPLAQE